MRHGVVYPLFLMYLGEAYALADRRDLAFELTQRAVALAHERGQRPYEAQAVRLVGEITACRDLPEHAYSYYRTALALAEELGMRPLVAHCHLGLSKLSWRTGERQDGQDHLLVATNMYREMGMTYWLKQAKPETGA